MSITTTGTQLARLLLTHLNLENRLPLLVEGRLQHACSRLCRSAPRYHRMQMARCNEEMGEKRTAQFNKSEATLENTINTIGSQISEMLDTDVKISFEGDPRGHTIKLILPDGAVAGVPGS